MKKLYYDADCGLCQRSALFLRFLGFKGELVTLDEASLHSWLDEINTLVFYDGRYWIKSDAVLMAIGSISWFHKIVYIGLVVPDFLRDFVYDVIASQRKRICKFDPKLKKKIKTTSEKY